LPLSERQTVLLLPLEGELDDLSGRLLLVHFRGRLVVDLAEAERLLRSESPPILAAVISSEPRVANLPEVLRTLRSASREEQLRFLAMGPRPPEAGRQKLRSAGVEWALYGAFSDTELRFVLNQAFHDAEKSDLRRDPRIPTPLTAKVRAATGVKVAMVYNLSQGGAYLETLRPSQAGVRVRVELPLPSGTLEIDSTVMSTNVTGNLRRENLPRGMGVRFDGLSADAEAALAHYIEERTAALRP
jgi:hypothetical protein